MTVNVGIANNLFVSRRNNYRVWFCEHWRQGPADLTDTFCRDAQSRADLIGRLAGAQHLDGALTQSPRLAAPVDACCAGCGDATQLHQADAACCGLVNLKGIEAVKVAALVAPANDGVAILGSCLNDARVACTAGGALH